MLNDRGDARVEYMTRCEFNVKGVVYKCLLDNLSTTGASVEITPSDRDYIQLGAKGALTVLFSSPVKYLCTVVRIKSTQLGLQFLDNDTM